MERKKLFGETEVSRLCLGTWQFAKDSNQWKLLSEKEEDELVKTSLELGVNFFDTAEGYGAGNSETSLGRALRNSGARRSEYVVATKVSDSNLSYHKLKDACNNSLSRLQLDYIDLYQVLTEKFFRFSEN